MSRESQWCIIIQLYTIRCTEWRHPVQRLNQFTALDRPRLDPIPRSIQNSSMIPSWNSVIKQPIRTFWRVQPSTKFCISYCYWPLINYMTFVLFWLWKLNAQYLILAFTVPDCLRSVLSVLPCTPGSSDSLITLKCMPVLGQLFDADGDVCRNCWIWASKLAQFSRTH